MSMARVAAAFALAVAVFALAAPLLAGRAAAAPAQELVVFEAASLKDAFAGLAPKFEAEHPGIKVTPTWPAARSCARRSSRARRPTCSRPPI